MMRGIRARNILLVIASLMFYAYGEPVYVLLMFGSAFMNYVLGRLIEGNVSKKKKLWLAITIFMNLGILAVFKYTDIILRNILHCGRNWFPPMHC